jgi:hypothetical protein
MIYPQVDPISLNEDITGHLFPIFYSIWDYGLVGISWRHVRNLFPIFSCDTKIKPNYLSGKQTTRCCGHRLSPLSAFLEALSTSVKSLSISSF